MARSKQEALRPLDIYLREKYGEDLVSGVEGTVVTSSGLTALVRISGSNNSQEVQKMKNIEVQPGDQVFLIRGGRSARWTIVSVFQRKGLGSSPSEAQSIGVTISPPSGLRAVSGILGACAVAWDAPTQQHVTFIVQISPDGSEANATQLLTTKGSYAIAHSDEPLFFRVRSMSTGNLVSSWTEFLEVQPTLAGAGVTDHGLLTGLDDDDHPQYHTDDRGDARYSPLGHDHDGDYLESVSVNPLTIEGDGTPESPLNVIGGTGISDHGELSGLEDDDHTQYLTEGRAQAWGDARYSQPGHTHSAYEAHLTNTNNPHGVDKADIGLDQVDNTNDASKPISFATNQALSTKLSFVSTTGTLSGDGTVASPLHVIGGGGSGALTAVYTNSTLGGDGTEEYPLGVSLPVINTNPLSNYLRGPSEKIGNVIYMLMVLDGRTNWAIKKTTRVAYGSFAIQYAVGDTDPTGNWSNKENLTYYNVEDIPSVPTPDEPYDTIIDFRPGGNGTTPGWVVFSTQNVNSFESVKGVWGTTGLLAIKNWAQYSNDPPNTLGVLMFSYYNKTGARQLLKSLHAQTSSKHGMTQPPRPYPVNTGTIININPPPSTRLYTNATGVSWQNIGLGNRYLEPGSYLEFISGGRLGNLPSVQYIDIRQDPYWEQIFDFHDSAYTNYISPSTILDQYAAEYGEWTGDAWEAIDDGGVYNTLGIKISMPAPYFVEYIEIDGGQFGTRQSMETAEFTIVTDAGTTVHNSNAGFFTGKRFAPKVETRMVIIQLATDGSVRPDPNNFISKIKISGRGATNPFA
jgi:hypothetical protein